MRQFFSTIKQAPERASTCANPVRLHPIAGMSGMSGANMNGTCEYSTLVSLGMMFRNVILMFEVIVMFMVLFLRMRQKLIV